jgi:hypothetical protein
MKVFGTILVIIGGVSFSLYFLLWTLEDYGRERISMWPIFLWIFLILVGIILMGKQKKRTT